MFTYCDSKERTKRFATRPVRIGNIFIGGTYPIRIQSMTTSDTKDVSATVEQIKRLADSGCELARITVQGMKEAEACEHIKTKLIQANYTIPLIADIHFYPPAALSVVEFVDKVRINPGNFVDKRATFKVIDYDEATYQAELDRIEEKFAPLVLKCKQLKRALRIGTNHGSLSDRIMNRFGDTPQGMVESALEYARVCRKYDFHDIIFSMKASNPLVMVQAYRLLNAEMMKLGWNYPLHLGVTEAGEGEDGRVKSAIGIGALLLDGLGDTVRVSLTEDPWLEIDPCQRLIAFAEHYAALPGFSSLYSQLLFNEKREILLPKEFSLHRDGTVALSCTVQELETPQFVKEVGFDLQLGQPQRKLDSPDLLLLVDKPSFSTINQINKFKDAGITVLQLQECGFVNHVPLSRSSIFVVSEESSADWHLLIDLAPQLIILKPKHDDRFHYARAFLSWLRQSPLQAPVLLNFDYSCSEEDLVIRASTECGALLVDGMADGLLLEGPYSKDLLRRLSFQILQAARMRTTKTDFISCPGCGRTLFSLQEVSARIRERTSHLPGVKIAIMGCIVNGPGEMADADFGYVGSGRDKIDLYVGKTCVEKGIDFSCATDRLIELIKAHGRWVEPVEQL